MKYEINQTGSITLRPATPEDAVSVATALRQQDLEDFAAFGITAPQEVIQQSILKSLESFTIETGTDTIGLGGIIQQETPQGVLVSLPWVVGTDALTPHQADLTRALIDRIANTRTVSGWAVRNDDTESTEILEDAGFFRGTMPEIPGGAAARYTFFVKAV